MKFSVEYVKQHPVMFGTIFVVFGLLVYLMLNKGAGAATQVVTTGPSEALQAAQLQAGAAIQAKQIDAAVASQSAQANLAAITAQINGQETIANMQMQYQMAQLAASSALGSKQIDASLLALQAQLDNNLELTNSNNSFMVDYAKVAADSAVQQVAINAALQQSLSADQLQAYKTGALLSAVSQVMPVDADNMLALISSQITGSSVSYYDRGSGSFTTSGGTITSGATSGGTVTVNGQTVSVH